MIVSTKYAGYLDIFTPAVSIEWLLFHLKKFAAMFLPLFRTKIEVPEKHIFLILGLKYQIWGCSHSKWLLCFDLPLLFMIYVIYFASNINSINRRWIWNPQVLNLLLNIVKLLKKLSWKGLLLVQEDDVELVFSEVWIYLRISLIKHLH